MDGYMKTRQIILPKTVVDEAQSGGISSLWLPVEIGYLPDARSQGLVMAEGSKDLVLGLCASGRGLFEYAKERREIRAGQAWVALPGIPFSYGPDEEEPWSLYWFRVRGGRISWLRNMLLEEGGDPVFAVKELFPVAALFEEIMDILDKGGYAKRNLDCAALAFGHLAAALSRGPSADRPRGETISERMEGVVAWIRGHVSDEIRVSALAARCNLSTPYFTACFRRHAGCGVLDFVARLRMERARGLLEDGVLPIKEIAASVGYADQLYFSRSFKKVYGRSPLASRAGARLRSLGDEDL
jgi:AraC family transcriptional regulator of arabinose operon